jgi:uroporphyrinogen-III synthase
MSEPLDVNTPSPASDRDAATSAPASPTAAGRAEPDFTSLAAQRRMRVIVTRPIHQALTWLEALNAQGLEAYPVPLIDIEPLEDTTPIRQTWDALDRYTLVMFVSANAVHHFFANKSAGASWPLSAMAASTGPGTTAALQQCGLRSAMIVEPLPGTGYDSEALWKRLSHRSWSGQRVLLVRGEEGRDWLAEQFRAAGAEVTPLAAYRRLAPVHGPETLTTLNEAIAEPAGFCWLFTSSEAIGHLVELRPHVDWASSRALVTHLRIAQAARSAGFGDVQLVESQPAAVVQAVRHLQHLPPKTT